MTDRNSYNPNEHDNDYYSRREEAPSDPYPQVEERYRRENVYQENAYQGSPYQGGPYQQENQEDARIRKVVREEMKNNKPKGGILRAIALILVGAILGTGIGAALLRSGILVDENDPAYTGRQPQEVSISLEEDATIENAIAAKSIPSIVGITTLVSRNLNTFPFGPSYDNFQYAESVGSGVIVDENGYILTNAHVIDNGRAERITVLFDNDEEAQAEVLWSDPTLDLAIIKVNKTGLPAIEIGSSSDVQVGDKAVAIGNPLGLELQSTLTSGVISGLNRTITINDGSIMDGLIQTDAAINSGNSGGALLDAEGKLIGINTAKPQASTGIGFAIPIDTAKPIIQRVQETGSFDSLYIGITGLNVQLARQMGVEDLPSETGVIVNEVYAGSPAAEAGLREGDIIVQLGDDDVDSMNSLKSSMLKYQPGDTVAIHYYRDGERKEGEITFTSYRFEQERSSLTKKEKSYTI